MTIKIAITGKSGSGKTTITKAFLNVLKNRYPEKSILLFDNDFGKCAVFKIGICCEGVLRNYTVAGKYLRIKDIMLMTAENTLDNVGVLG